MPVEYTIRRTGKTYEAVISSEGKEVASISAGEGLTRTLEAAGDGSWRLDPRVHGEVRPFSMNVTAAEGDAEPVLTIRNHVFRHGGKFYMLTGIPEDLPPANHMLGGRYICRLDRFPFHDLETIDGETWGRLKRQRGPAVGEIDGLGLEGHRVKLSEELQGIGLQLAAASYLLYSTA
jgi:hypothetical protein